MKIYDIVVLGAGASGLAFANFCNNQNIALIDANNSIAPKMKISGGGRCNITNKSVSSKNYLGDRKFIENILSNFDNKDLINFLNNNNVQTTLENKIVNGQYFCKTSKNIINMLISKIDKKNIFLNRKILEINKKDNYFIIKTSNGQFHSQKLVVATGGLSYPSLNSSSIGYDIAKQFGHKIIKTDPALVGFTVQKEQFWFKNLSGLSLRAKIKVDNKEFIDNILFTHKGCSGPIILNASLYWKKGHININFLPDKKSYLPKRFLKEFRNSLEEKSKEKEKLQNYSFSPAGNFGYTKAEVTKGGIDTAQIDSNTMESKIQKDLYFLGEVLDVTGELGGYNFQFAFSCAKICANKINQ
jgi:predicted Rossmann fold flavoprotein